MDLSGAELLVVALAGLAAGMLNAVVGSGSLVTFPTLIALGVPPLTANVSNTIGLIPGAVTGVYGYRREVSRLPRQALRLLSATILGALLGTALLLAFPESVFAAVVPALIALAVLLVLVQPFVARRSQQRAARPSPSHARWLWPAVGLTGVYGAYFGAAQGVILIGVLSLGLALGLQEVNALKNVLAGTANLVAGVVFAVVADVDWPVAGMIALGSALGGVAGARVARSLPSPVLRLVVVVVGVVALVTVLS